MHKNNFKILAPLADVGDVGRLKASGVDEFYGGYVTPVMAKQWPLAFLVLNRRGEGGSFEERGRFQAALRAAAENVPVYVAVNGFYTQEQYKGLRTLIRDIETEPGVSGVIVSDLGFLSFLKARKSFKKPVHLSTLAACFNAEAINFYGHLGVSRVVLD